MQRRSNPEALRQRLVAGDLATVRRELAAGQRGSHTIHQHCVTWGELCEEVGLFELAREEYEAALDQNPDDRKALHLLLDLCASRGDRDRFLRHLSRAFERQPADGEILARLVPELKARALLSRLKRVLDLAREAGADPELLASLSRETSLEEAGRGSALLPHEGDLVRFLELFAGREEVHARQWHDSVRGTGYTPVHQPLSVQLLRNHLLGNVTLGVYLLHLDGCVSFFALDIDLEKSALEAQRADPEALGAMKEALEHMTSTWLVWFRELGFDPLLEDSGFKGRHLWVFLEHPMDARRIHQLGRLLLASQPPPDFPISLEFFPKQGRRKGKGLGNLIKLPLGLHQKSGRRAVFLGDEGQVIQEPWERLRRIKPASEELVARVMERLEALQPGGLTAAGGATAGIWLEPGGEGEDPLLPSLGPLPRRQIPTWTDGHFESDRQVSHLLKHCAVLAALKEKVDGGCGLLYDEQVVLRHTLGHLPQGVLAVNHLLHRCQNVLPEMFLKSPLKGSPASCPRIRQRLGELTCQVACDCVFPFAPESYPHPLLHLRTLEGEEVAPGAERTELDPEALARAYGALRRRGESITQEREALERGLMAILRQQPGGTLELAEGCYRLQTKDGRQQVVWKPAQAGHEPLPESDQGSKQRQPPPKADRSLPAEGT